MSVTVKTITYDKNLVDKLQPDKFYEIRDEYGYYKNRKKPYPDYKVSMTYEGSGYELYCLVKCPDVDGILVHIDWAIGNDPDNDEYVPEESSYIEYLQTKMKDPLVVDKIRKFIVYEELEIEIELY